jgi:hypothetical protein
MPGELVCVVPLLIARKARGAMETFMNGAMVIEAALLSFLLALWMTWTGLRGLFQLMPARSSQVARRIVQPIRFVANRKHGNRQREAA